MAFKHGRDTELWLGGVDVSAYFNNLDFSADVDTVESTTFKKTWKTHVPGAAVSTVDAAGNYDPDFGSVEDTLAVTAGAILTAGPAGMEAAGDQARLVKIHSTGYVESSPVGGLVAFTWRVISDGSVGLGVVLEPLASKSADGNGATHTGPVGGSANGAVAHLHVTAVSASDNITVTLQDSANGTDWLAITGGAFANAAAIGAQRIEIPGTIRRYTRATWDVTGTAVDITFGVALARL